MERADKGVYLFTACDSFALNNIDASALRVNIYNLTLTLNHEPNAWHRFWQDDRGGYAAFASGFGRQVRHFERPVVMLCLKQLYGLPKNRKGNKFRSDTNIKYDSHFITSHF